MPVLHAAVRFFGKTFSLTGLALSLLGFSATEVKRLDLLLARWRDSYYGGKIHGVWCQGRYS